jgi:hypothetical protein
MWIKFKLRKFYLSCLWKLNNRFVIILYYYMVVFLIFYLRSRVHLNVMLMLLKILKIIEMLFGINSVYDCFVKILSVIFKHAILSVVYIVSNHKQVI